MIRIFSKLKHILIITVILITMLFGILIYRQYSQLDIRKIENETESLINLSRDFTLIYSFYQKLANTYYNESISENTDFLIELDSFNKPINGIAKQDSTQFIELLTDSFENANNDHFSYYKIYNVDNTLVGALSHEELNDGTNYTYRFPLYYGGEVIGYIELGLSLDAFINTLHQFTGQTSFTLFKTTEYANFDAINSPNSFSASLFGEEFFVNDTSMEQYYNTISQKSRQHLADFSQAVKSIIYEDLLLNNDFVEHKKIDKTYYTLSFITMDSSLNNKGYFVHFQENEALTELHNNLTISISLFVILYLTLVFIIGFIYYILHYLYHFSYTDHLTKIYNRHKFFEVIERNIYDYHRYNYQFTILIIDIDNFKLINDTYGHNTGDQVLIELVRVIESSLRTTDYVFRWGGEEFMVLLSHCETNIGYQVAEKLRSNIHNHNFSLPHNHQVTASLGIASYDNCQSIEEMISHADKALYESKNDGKNQSTVFTD